MSLPYSPILVTKSKFFTVESLIEVLLQKTVMDTKRGIQVYICWKLTYVCILCRLKMPRSLQGKDHAISARLEFFLDKEISLWSFLTWLWRHGERGKVWQLCCLYRPLVRNSSSMVPVKKVIFNIQMHHDIPDLDLTFLSTDVQNVIVFSIKGLKFRCTSWWIEWITLRALHSTSTCGVPFLYSLTRSLGRNNQGNILHTKNWVHVPIARIRNTA